MSTLQIFDALDAATEAALRASIQKHGVLVPVAVDQDGRVLDGHHRQRIATEIGTSYKTIEHWVAGDTHAKEIARTLNEDRRQLPIEQRREVVADLREQGHSQRAIAGALGVAKTTVHRDLSGGPSGPPDEVSPVGDSDPVSPAGDASPGERVVSIDATPERVKGTDGKSYPAKKAKPVHSEDEQAEQDRLERCERITYSYATAVSALHGLTFGEPSNPAYIREHWLPAKNPLAGLPIEFLTTADGIRDLALKLMDVAYDLETNTETGALPWA